MGSTVDYTDVPQVSADALMIMMEQMITVGRGLVLLRGIEDRDLRAVESAAWEKLDGTAPEKLAALLRFRSLVAVFAGARLRDLFLQRGLALMVPAMDIAAEMRLNVQWGFSPVKFVRALEVSLKEMDRRAAALRVTRTAELQVGMA